MNSTGTASTPSERGQVGLDDERLDYRLFYDPFSFAAFEEPYSTYRLLRDHAPVYYSERRNIWVLSRYDDVRGPLRQHEVFSSAQGDDIDQRQEGYSAGDIVSVDPPRHTVLRNLVKGGFAMREILPREETIRQLATQLLEPIIRDGGGDVAADYCWPLALGGGMRLLGTPPGDDRMLGELLDRAMVRTIGSGELGQDAVAANQETEEYFQALVEDRRRQLRDGGSDGSTADLLGRVAIGVEDGTIEEEEAPGLMHLLFSASIDTVASMLTTQFALLDQWPGARQRLSADPGLIPNAVEEGLRYDSPIQYTARVSTRPVELHDVAIPEGASVVLLVGSGNRDERRFPNADVFDVARDARRSVVFGEGIHTCLGAPLARLEGRVSMQVVLELAPRYQIVGTPQRTAKHMIRGFSYLPIQV